MKRLIPLIIILIIACSSYSTEQITSISRASYLEFARVSADWTWEHRDSIETSWREKWDPNTIWGYRPPPHLLEMATIYATLYDLEDNPTYAKRAKRVLLGYGDYRREYPEEAARQRPDYTQGVPALPDFFTTMRYVKSYDILNRKGYLDNSEQEKIENLIAHSIEYILQTQEWGAMNRSALRAETLAWAVRALPEHPRAKHWRTYEQALGFDNWGNWEIEDATIYHGVWLYALLGYADAKNQIEELFHLPEMYYYGQYFLHLMCPAGMSPDFGDARWLSNWHRMMVFFEAAANFYNDPELKWAASVIGQNFVDFGQTHRTGLGLILLDCYRYGTDDITPVCPDELSEEVMEDVVGKKIVFRNGWESTSTYMLLNYRDEGDGGLLFRDYLRDGIPVEEEKMTHGHADENSIVLLMNNGSILLRDGGYRDYMPSGPYGAYRQDYFHNRMCVRPAKIWMGQKEGEWRYSPEDHPEIPGQSVLDFLHNAGSYRQVRTQKVDFLTFDDFDYSRTRLIDDKMGYQWDRVITYIKDPEMFVVFDIVKATEEEWMTAANLWHTRKIVAQGDHWYDTQYDSLRNKSLAPENNLLIYFPMTHYRLEQVEPEKRNYQDEWVISQYTGQHFELGQHIGFVTVLIPHPSAEDPTPWLNKIQYIDSGPPGKGMSVEIQYQDRTIQVGVKSDMRMDMIRDYRRPKYTYESGRMQFGKLETNGDFFYTDRSGNQLSFTVVNLSKAVYDGQELFSQLPSQFGLAYDGSSDEYGIGKARYWRDEITLKLPE